jgi:hypothetical protein
MSLDKGESMTMRSILGMFCGTRIGMVALLLALGMGALAVSAENDKKSPDKDKVQGTLHTVEARVTSPSGTGAGTNVLAEKQPGSFTIPKGSKGAKLKYSFADPKLDYTSTKLRGSNIYSVTEKRYMHELDHNPDFELPPGEYKFVVGGTPGASGTLTYTTVPTTDTKPPTGPTGPPKKHHSSPPPTSDTTKTGVKTTPLHPGGEGKSKVQVHLDMTITDSRGVTQWSGEVSATLTVSAGAIRLDFDTNPGEHPNKTDRWEGALTSQGQVLTVKGSTLKYYPPMAAGGPTTTWRGTFEGHLEGTVLKGTMAAHMVIPDIRGDVTADMKAKWSIKDFAK